MRVVWLHMLVATGIASLSASALASGALEVSMRYPADAKGLRIDRGKGVIEVVLANKGPEPIDVSERSIPKPNRNGMLFDNFFDIRTDAGARASYLGIFVSWADIEGPYVRIRPGRELVLTVDMPTNYRLEPGGSYEVQLRPVRYLPRARDHYALYSFDEGHRLMQRAEPDRALSLRISEEARTIARSRAAKAFAL